MPKEEQIRKFFEHYGRSYADNVYGNSSMKWALVRFAKAIINRDDIEYAASEVIGEIFDEVDDRIANHR